jgi:integrase
MQTITPELKALLSQLSQHLQEDPEPDNNPHFSLSLGELWEKYTLHKAEHLAATTIKKDFGAVRRYINKTCGDLNQAQKIRAQLLEATTSRSAKKMLMQINACCTWAFDYGLIEYNPFEKLKIKARKPTANIQPFTEEERERIVKAFRETESFYAPLIEFLFLTGCRPSEAIALRWRHIDVALTRITFCEARVYGITKGTKTNKSRIFPINPKLRSLLTAIKPRVTRGDDLVFPSKNGLGIDEHNLVRRQWNGILEELGITRRPLYNCRHTFISNCLGKGIQIQQVAVWVGNSPRTIWEHYAGITNHQEVPDI